MKKTPILLAILLLFTSLSCGVPEDNKPGTIASPLIDRAEIPEDISVSSTHGKDERCLSSSERKATNTLRPSLEAP